jgi:hypothetical protein
MKRFLLVLFLLLCLASSAQAGGFRRLPVSPYAIQPYGYTYRSYGTPYVPYSPYGYYRRPVYGYGYGGPVFLDYRRVYSVPW